MQNSAMNNGYMYVPLDAQTAILSGKSDAGQNRHLVPLCVPWPRRTPDTLGTIARLRAFRFLVASGVGGEAVGLAANEWLAI